MDSNSNETKDIILGYVISLMKQVRNVIFPIETPWQTLRQFNNK